ncbi:molybdopterin molybdotransferase MoeA [Agrococcus sp. SGAir0287]|uniref:molybdopterin molybdotransferase MoeA n=1 Tax=Agrococcus sp. SGAir0287 TaxID=2070347 RepID=UPI0010CD1E59|nr:gephyrin-like molybdotransferase Glp [Agrococcus sp. SGAir0287]QCR19053.1 molybdopterin molybdenumtransferase MoeA [Agrococcus sp. SGAir0287]
MSGMRTVEEHLGAVLALVRPLGTRVVPVQVAHGAVLRVPVLAANDIPAFDNSAMDGFAVRHADVAAASADAPVRLAVVADVPAGSGADPRLEAGQAARIMTGAALPSDADAIVPFEDTLGGLADSLDTAAVVAAPRAAGVFVRRAGQDVRRGDVVLEAGVRMGPLQCSAAAAAGVGELVVSERPRVAVVSTGSELVEPGAALTRGRIPDSNGVLLASLARDAGADVVLQATIDDEGAGLRRLVDELARTDLVILSGGVSAGAYEVVRTELADAMDFVRVAMQPGKPQGLGRLPSGTVLVGLPGNPVSAAVSFETFVRPALLAMQGRVGGERPRLRLPATQGWTTPPRRRQHLPAVVDRSDPARWTVAPASAGGSGSHLAGGLGRAEAYVVVPAEVEAVAVGDLVDVMLIA